MNATELAAWVGASTGLLSFGWNIYIKVTSGPRLRVASFANMIIMPPPPGNPKYLSVSVTNQGTTPTTITNLGLCVYKSRWARMRRRGSQHFVIANYEGKQLPLKLEVGEEWRPLIKQDERLTNLLGTDKLWVTIFHTFAKYPIEAMILCPKAADSPKGK